MSKTKVNYTNPNSNTLTQMNFTNNEIILMVGILRLINRVPSEQRITPAYVMMFIKKTVPTYVEYNKNNSSTYKSGYLAQFVFIARSYNNYELITAQYHKKFPLL